MAGFCSRKWCSSIYAPRWYPSYSIRTDFSEPWPWTSVRVWERYTRDCRLLKLVRISVDGGCGPPSTSELNRSFEYCLRREIEPQKPNSFLAQMILRGTILDQQTFVLLIKFYCARLTYHRVFDIVPSMKAMGVEADGSFYIYLLSRVCARFGHNVGYELLKKLKSSYPLPLLCYNAVARRYCTRKMTEETATILNDMLVDMKQHQVYPDERFCNWLLKAVTVNGGENAIKALCLGKLAFAKGIRVGAVSPIFDGSLYKGIEEGTMD